jgi:hypothetical protein
MRYARMRRWLVVCALVACENHTPPPPPQPAPAISNDGLTRIEDLPKLADHRDPKTPYDCTITSALQGFAPGTRVVACGMLERDATPAALDAMNACVERALARAQPLVFGQAIQGTDSGIADAILVRSEQGRLVAYEARFDSDPCGGSCDDRGGTRIVRCGAPRPGTGCYEMRTCLQCDGEIVETCRHGRPSTVPRAEAERRRAELLGPKPASFGPPLEPL